MALIGYGLQHLVPTVATTLTVPAGASSALIQAQGGSIWLTFDGTTPVAADGSGFRLLDGQSYLSVSDPDGIQVIGQNVSTTLSLAALAADLTLTVTSSTGFATAGLVIIDSELISYTGTTATTLTGCLRGQQGTVAASHLINAPVSVRPVVRCEVHYFG